MNESSKRYLDTIQHSVEHMARLLEDLLNLSRIGRYELRTQPCDLNALVDDVMSDAKAEIGDQGPDYRVADRRLAGVVDCVPALMKQVFLSA